MAIRYAILCVVHCGRACFGACTWQQVGLLCRQEISRCDVVCYLSWNWICLVSDFRLCAFVFGIRVYVCFMSILCHLCYNLLCKCIKILIFRCPFIRLLAAISFPIKYEGVFCDIRIICLTIYVLCDSMII